MKKKLQSPFNTRQFMVEKNFELYYYNDTKPLTVHAHTHPYYEFYFFLEGDVSYIIRNDCFPLQFGDFVVVPPGIRHHACINNNTKPYRRFVFWVSADYMQWIAEICPSFSFVTEELSDSSPVYLFHNDRIAFNSILRNIIHFLEEIHGNNYGKEDNVTLRALSLLMNLCRIMHNQLYPDAARPKQDLYRKVLDYIENHLEENITLDRLAEIFFVSKYHIAHTFKEHIGLSVHQYILKKHLLAVRSALLVNEQISKVYTLYGFSDYPGFFRAFKKEFGMSPKAYRQMADTAAIFSKEAANPVRPEK